MNRTEPRPSPHNASQIGDRSAEYSWEVFVLQVVMQVHICTFYSITLILQLDFVIVEV